MNQISSRWLRCQTPLLSNSGCVNDFINKPSIWPCYTEGTRQMLSPILRTGEKWLRFQQSKFGADREAAPIWEEILNPGWKNSKVLPLVPVPTHIRVCTLMGAGGFMRVASVPGPKNPELGPCHGQSLRQRNEEVGKSPLLGENVSLERLNSESLCLKLLSILKRVGEWLF